jgi:hypothetical protein
MRLGLSVLYLAGRCDANFGDMHACQRTNG